LLALSADSALLRFSPAGASFLIVNNAIISFSFKANRRQQQQRGKKSNSYRITGHKKEIKQKKEKRKGGRLLLGFLACCGNMLPRFLSSFFISGMEKKPDACAKFKLCCFVACFSLLLLAALCRC